nr:carboxypeptidase regulatory-like domain-containing protein [uncultured Lacibacter sp.]
MNYFYLSLLLSILSVNSNAQSTEFKMPSIAPEVIKQVQRGGTGGTSSHIRIRCGTGTVGREPLFIVDGVPYEQSEIKTLNPHDIVEITVLKDLHATAIYGCRATNGVVLITTKKAYHRKFVIKDEHTQLAVANATIEATSTKTNKRISFAANEWGRFETDSLQSLDYMLTISAEGYKTQTISLKIVQQNSGEIKLEAVQQAKKQMDVNSFALFRIYPTQISKSGAVTISFSHVKPGQYHLRMFNVAGQIFSAMQKQISTKNETMQIHIPDNAMPGMYIIQIVNEQQQLIYSSKLLVQ